METNLALVGDTADETRARLLRQKVRDIGSKAIPFGQLIRRFSPEPLPRIPGILPGEDQARRIFVTAPSKSLKTWFVYEMVYTLGTGENFLGLVELVHGEWRQEIDEEGNPVSRRVKVQGAGDPLRTLYLQMENTEYSMEVRGRAIAESHGHVVEPDDEAATEEDFIMIVPRIELNLLDAIHIEAIIEVAKDFDIVVFDSTYNMVMRTLNDDEVAKMLTQVINRMVDEAGVTIIAIHHASTKGEAGAVSKARESMGSTFFTSAFWDHEIRLNYDRDNKQLDLTFVSRDSDYDTKSFEFLGPSAVDENGAPTRGGMWAEINHDDDIRKLVAKIRDWLDEDPSNRVWVANNGIRIAGTITTQVDLAAHLQTRVDWIKEAVRRIDTADNIPHLPSTIGDIQ